MHPGPAHLIDHAFIRFTKPHVKPSGAEELTEDAIVAAHEMIDRIEDAAREFNAPQLLDRMTLTRPRPLTFDEIHLRWEEEPFALPVEMPETRPLVARVCPARGRLRGGLVLVHGWRQPVLGAIGRFGRYAAARGVATACLELPQHLSRRVRGRPIGPAFISLRPKEMLGALFYSAFEVEWLRQGLGRALGVPVGILGASIGGWVCELHMSMFEPDFACQIDPVASPAKMLEEGPLLEPIRASLSLEKLDLLLDLLRDLSPVHREPLIPGRLISVITGRYDLVTPYEDVTAYAAGVGSRPVQVKPHSHISMLYFNPDLFPGVWSEVDALVREAGE